MNRKEKILECLKDYENLTMIEPIIDDVVFLEENLVELKKLPFIVVHPNNPNLQKYTPAFKQYKELMQSYLNAMKILIKCVNGTEGESELAKLLKEFE